MSSHTTNILDTQSDYTSIRIHRNTIKKLDRIGRYQDSYNTIIDRLVSERLRIGIDPNSSDGGSF
jgi:hypothetical protein